MPVLTLVDHRPLLLAGRLDRHREVQEGGRQAQREIRRLKRDPPAGAEQREAKGHMKELDRRIVFTRHAREKMLDRGVSEEDVTKAVCVGRREAARHELWQYCINLQFNRRWSGKYYGIKQVIPVIAEEEERYVVVTVYAFYFQEGQEQ